MINANRNKKKVKKMFKFLQKFLNNKNLKLNVTNLK